jgi:hypothetical protein
MPAVKPTQAPPQHLLQLRQPLLEVRGTLLGLALEPLKAGLLLGALLLLLRP